MGRVSLILLRQLGALGQDVTALDWCANPLANAAATRSERLPLRCGRARTALWHLDLLRRVRHIPHDVLVDPTGYPDALGRHARLVLLVHDVSMLQRGVYRPGKRVWFRALWGRALCKARLCVCVSADTRERLLAAYALEPSRCVVVPNGIELEAHGLEPPVPAGIDGPFYLAVGRLEHRKNSARLVAAYARARQLGVTARLVLVGRPGHGGREVLRRLAAPDLAGAVIRLEDVGEDRLDALYRGARALLFPSLAEGFGMPILEAMRAGTPVLTSNTTAMPEVAGDAALVVDPMDGAAIAQAIVRIDRDPTLRSTLAGRGRERVRIFDAAAVGRRWVEILGSLA